MDPPLLSQHFGLGAEDVAQIIIATRLAGQSLLDLGREIVPVYVALIVERAICETHSIGPGQTKLILWGEVRPLQD